MPFSFYRSRTETFLIFLVPLLYANLGRLESNFKGLGKQPFENLMSTCRIIASPNVPHSSAKPLRHNTALLFCKPIACIVHSCKFQVTMKLEQQPPAVQQNAQKAALLQEFYDAKMDAEKNITTYNQHSAAYDDWANDGTWIAPKKLAEAVHDLSVAGQKILDFGAGTGLFGVQLKRLESTCLLDGADISRGMLERADINYGAKLYDTKHVGLLNQDYSLPSQSYDGVAAAGIIGTHVGFDEVLKLMPSVKEGGFLAYTIKKDVNESYALDHYQNGLPQGWTLEKTLEAGNLIPDHPDIFHQIVVFRRHKSA